MGNNAQLIVVSLFVMQWDHASGHGSHCGTVEQRDAVGQADGPPLAAAHQDTPLQQGEPLGSRDGS